MGYAVLLFSRFSANFFKICTNILVPVLSEELGFSMSIGGLLTAMFFIPYALMQILSAPICKRFGSFRTAFGGMVIVTIGALCFAFGKSLPAFFIGRFLFGLGSGPTYTCCFYYLHKRYDSHKFALLTGIDFAFSNAAGVIATTPLKLCIDRFGVSATCLGCTYPMFAVSLILLAFSIKVKDGSGRGTEGLLEMQKKALTTIGSNRPLLWASALCICYAMIQQCYNSLWCTAWAINAFTVDSSLTALTGTSFLIALMIGCLCSEPLHLKGREFEQTTGMFGWLFLVSFGMTIACHTLSLFVPALMSVFIFGFANGLMAVQIYTLIRKRAGSEMATLTVGMVNFLCNIMTVAGQGISGVLIDRLSYTPVTLIFWAVFFVVIMGFSISCKKQRRKAA